MNIWKLYKPPYNIQVVGKVPKGLPGYVGDTFFPLVGETGKTLVLAVLVRLAAIRRQVEKAAGVLDL